MAAARGKASCPKTARSDEKSAFHQIPIKYPSAWLYCGCNRLSARRRDPGKDLRPIWQVAHQVICSIGIAHPDSKLVANHLEGRQRSGILQQRTSFLLAVPPEPNNLNYSS